MTLNTCSAHQRKRKLATNAILQATVALSHNEKRGTSSEKSADGKRRRRGRRKSEERRKKTEAKIFLAQTLHHTPLTHLRRLTRHYLDEKREGRGNERRTLVSSPHSTRAEKFVDGKEEEKRQQKVKKNISGRLSIYLSHLHPPTTPRTP